MRQVYEIARGYLPDYAWFIQRDEDDPGRIVSEVRIPIEDWRDMGGPERLMVTIEPEEG